jgi:hypothetical protein
MSSRDANRASSDTTVVAPPRDARSARGTFRRLRMAGLTELEAGNLTAHLNGLRAAERGWTVKEIENLLFIRALVEQGRI